jgi:LmbE family N-acetylglucosaminyl deacetylase
MSDSAKRQFVLRLAGARALMVLLCISASLHLTTPEQIRPVYDQGALGLTQLLKRLNTNGSVLMIGAHPDDEDTALLAYLARGESARTAYLSLTRGDGGQNIIGPELGEALGVIRTEELLQARKLDGAEQFFTRAYDFGFSKTLAEAKNRWDEKVILCDVVNVIRSYKPLVVISQFTGTPIDGHGQHQFAGYISPIAVKAAADPRQCDDAGEPWKVAKFYVRHRGPGEPTLRINTGKYDPLLGRTYFEIAMHARSQHRSQEQGVLELRGDQFSSLKLEGSGAKESSIFHGLETDGRTGDFDMSDRSKLLRQLIAAYPSSDRKPLVAEAIAMGTGLQIDALAESETVIPGEAFAVSVKAFVPTEGVKVSEISLVARIGPERWSIVPAAAPETNNPAFVVREATPHAQYFRVTPGPDVWPTQPYWLVEPRDGDLYRWKGRAEDDSTPFQPGPLKARVKVEIQGREIVFERDVQFRFADDIRGEIRRNVDVVPRATLDADQPLVLVSTSPVAQTKKISFTVKNNSGAPAKAKPSIAFDAASAAWGGKTNTPEILLGRRGSTTQFSFEITIPEHTRPGRYSITGDVLVDGKYYGASSMLSVAYPHIQTHRFYRPAQVDFQVIDLQTVPVKIGYIRGSGDRVPEAIRQMGLTVEEIDEKFISTGDLAQFETIVLGIRAFQVRPDVVANNQRLIDFVKNGGTLIVQYQLPPTYSQQNLTPFPTQMGPRVVDENAVVTIAEPANPIFNFPNKITSDDFTGWVQERNLYNFVQMDPKYVGLLESHDAGEAENKGGLVVADIGKGKYVYCSYSLFRQLPAGVPGAYRLLANMLSLPKAPR